MWTLYARWQARWVYAAIASVALFGAVVVGCPLAHGQVADASRDYELFVCAMEDFSMWPNYVLITVVDGRSGNEQQVAISSSALRSALRIEHDIPFVDLADVNPIAIASHDRRFTFYRNPALAVVQPDYTPALLGDVRTRLKDLTNDELIEVLEDKLGPRGEIIEHPLLSALYGDHEDNYRGCNDAIAHVLLERQILCGVGSCFGSGVYIEKARCLRVRR